MSVSAICRRATFQKQKPRLTLAVTGLERVSLDGRQSCQPGRRTDSPHLSVSLSSLDLCSLLSALPTPMLSPPRAHS